MSLKDIICSHLIESTKNAGAICHQEQGQKKKRHLFQFFKQSIKK